MTAHMVVADLGDRALAHRLAGLLQDIIEPTPEALTLFENGPSGWRIEAYYPEAPDTEALHAQLASFAGDSVPELLASPVPDKNWVAISQAALPPVTAGRFTVHGSHDTGRVPRGPNSILIDAGEAFGTAHHATTYGCLLAIDRILRSRTFRRVLDLGCGSGVLAIAVARILPHAQILASDLDLQSVMVARENMRVNAVAHRIDAFAAEGLEAPKLRRPGAFDLVIANILADPLISLAPAIARALEPGGMALLSGILIDQAPAVISAYRAHGFTLVSHDRHTGWSALTLVRR